LPVACENAIASPATIRPTIGSNTTRERLETKRNVSRPPRTIRLVPTPIATASASVQPNWATSGCPNAVSGSGGSAYALVLNPVNDPIPSETSVPIPAASNPGSRIRRSLPPPSPVASIRITAAITGESKINDSAENAPAAPMIWSACGGVLRRTRLTARTAEPVPIAISGPSGPRTRPLLIVASPARTTPGNAPGPPEGLIERPSAGM